MVDLLIPDSYEEKLALNGIEITSFGNGIVCFEVLGLTYHSGMRDEIAGAISGLLNFNPNYIVSGLDSSRVGEHEHAIVSFAERVMGG